MRYFVLILANLLGVETVGFGPGGPFYKVARVTLRQGDGPAKSTWAVLCMWGIAATAPSRVAAQWRCDEFEVQRIYNDAVSDDAQQEVGLWPIHK